METDDCCCVDTKIAYLYHTLGDEPTPGSGSYARFWVLDTGVELSGKPNRWGLLQLSTLILGGFMIFFKSAAIIILNISKFFRLILSYENKRPGHYGISIDL